MDKHPVDVGQPIIYTSVLVDAGKQGAQGASLERPAFCVMSQEAPIKSRSAEGASVSLPAKGAMEAIELCYNEAYFRSKEH